MFRLETVADHHVHDLGDRQPGKRLRGDDLAVAQHDDTVADLEDLVQAMRDVDDGDVLGLQLPEDAE
jgi:hypothetical protein